MFIEVKFLNPISFIISVIKFNNQITCWTCISEVQDKHFLTREYRQIQIFLGFFVISLPLKCVLNSSTIKTVAGTQSTVSRWTSAEESGLLCSSDSSRRGKKQTWRRPLGRWMTTLLGKIQTEDVDAIKTQLKSFGSKCAATPRRFITKHEF